MKPTTSAAQVTANQANAQKSTGPKNSKSTRYNAVKHGLVSEGVTELDGPENFAALLAQLEKEYQPEGIMEHELLRRIAIGIIRGRRAHHLEAQEITAQLNPPLTEVKLTAMGELHENSIYKTETVELLDAGLPAQLSPAGIDHVIKTFLRYEATIENSLLRCLKQLDQMQEQRREKQAAAAVLAPTA